MYLVKEKSLDQLNYRYFYPTNQEVKNREAALL